MATSLGQLLDSLAETAENTPRTPAARADAATAIGQLGRALNQLRHDGVSREAGDRRERQVAALATSCTELAKHAPVNESDLAKLAAAAADSLALLHDHTTTSSRWATATVLADAVTPLAELVDDGVRTGAAGHLAQVHRHSLLVQQSAALHPPARGDAAVLDRPLSGSVPSGVEPADVVPDAIAMLLRATSDTGAVPTVAEVLTYTLAAESLSAAAQRLDTTAPMGSGHLASPAWRDVREALHPYNDGSRQRHPHAPPAVHAALRLHASLTGPSSEATLGTPSVRGVVAAAAQHLPTLASQLLYRTVRSWADECSLVAYARDLPPREERVAPYLRGYRPGGVIRANSEDLQPVVGALHNARLLSLAVAIGVGGDARPDFPRRAYAANQELMERPEAPGALEAASREAGRQLLLGRNRPPGPTCSR